MAELVLDRLRDLQEADQELRRLQSRKTAQDRSVRIRAEQIESHQQHIEALRKKRHDVRVKADLKELEVRQKRADIERLKGQQLQIKDNRQYQILQNEIKFAELAIGKLEDDILNDYEDIETIDRELAQAQEELKQHQQELEALRLQCEAKKDTVDAEIQTCRARRNEIAATLPSDAVRQFDRIADRLDGEALAAVVLDEIEGTYVCTGCNMSVTQNTYVQLRGRIEKLVTCPNCTRILYVEDS